VVVSIGPARPDSPEALELTSALNEYLSALYPPEENFLAFADDEVGGKRGVFLVAREGDRAVGCGAVRRLSTSTAELKRMFVRPEARGRGVGKRLLAELESWSAQAGVSRLVLETGVRQSEAMALYESLGYHRIPCFGEYAGSRQSLCYEKQL